MTVDVQLVGLLLVLYVLRAAPWHGAYWLQAALSVCPSVTSRYHVETSERIEWCSFIRQVVQGHSFLRPNLTLQFTREKPRAAAIN